MSKKIWRGHENNQGTWHREVYSGAETRNCTVVPDACNFPVKDAIYFIKAAKRLGPGWFHVDPDPVCAEEWNAMADAFDRFLRSEEKLKNKANRKRGTRPTTPLERKPVEP